VNNLSQERLDNQLWELDVTLLKDTPTDVYEKWLEVYGEIAGERKRLQAIEAERDNLLKLLNDIDYELEWGDAENAIVRCKKMIRKVTEGVDTHDQNGN
jgi:hypothetical protein